MIAPLVAGNWKMNGDAAFIEALLAGIIEGLAAKPLQRCEMMVLPPAIFFESVVRQLNASPVSVGIQDVDQRDSGAVTGAISAKMAANQGAAAVLVGHSERRTLFADSDEIVAEKFLRCLEAGVTTIVCVGETLAEREAGKTLAVVARQLQAVVEAAGSKSLAGLMVAYEPVWAIGTGKNATPEQAEEVHRSLREHLAGIDENLAQETRILYGGSVTPDNAALLFEQENINGALVGGASLQAESFVDICRAAEEL